MDHRYALSYNLYIPSGLHDSIKMLWSKACKKIINYSIVYIELKKSILQKAFAGDLKTEKAEKPRRGERIVGNTFNPNTTQPRRGERIIGNTFNPITT